MTIIIAPTVAGLIFDLDGTLADTMALHYAAWHETFTAYGITCPQAFLESLNGVPTEIIVTYFNETFGYCLDPVQFAKEKEMRARAKLPQARPIPLVAAVVRNNRGRLPMAVATGGKLANAEMILQAIDMVSCFEALVTADDPVLPKPAPDIFLEAARRLQVEPDHCQVFEDADCGLEAARKAGMFTTDVRLLLQGPDTTVGTVRRT
jgi:beta-phosphoglucomutase-like phosphatase (HAD superfamily)